MKFFAFRLAILASLIAAPLLVSAQGAPPDWSVLSRPRTHQPAPTTAAITTTDLMTRLFIFADDSMMGRRLADAGNVKATDYIAHEAARMGLKPMGDSGTFFQTVNVVTRSFDSTSRFTAGAVSLTPWTDFVLRDAGPGARALTGARIIYGGTLADSTTLIDSAAAAGKLVLVDAPGGALSLRARANIGAAMLKFSAAAGIAVVNLDDVPPQYIAFFRRQAQMIRSEPVYPPVPAVLLLSRSAAAKLLGKPIEAAKPGSIGATVTSAPRIIESPLAYPARNVVAMIEGSDPTLRSEFVAIGAHNDHIGFDSQPVAHDSIYVVNHLFRQQGADDPNPELTPAQSAEVKGILAAIRKGNNGASARLDSIYNGADDDGSGSVSVLEIAQYFAAKKVKPKRSLLFVWHVGEEEGLYGSEWITDHPPVARDSIITQLNIDMIGRGDAADVTGTTRDGALIHGSADYLQLIGSRRLSTQLGDIADSVNRTEKRPLAIDYSLDATGHPQRIYCRSDHYSYARYGIPIIFFTTGGHADYHQVTDEPQYIDYDRMARVAQYVADVATAVGNRTAPPLVDQPKPDPHGRCVQ